MEVAHQTRKRHVLSSHLRKVQSTQVEFQWFAIAEECWRRKPNRQSFLSVRNEESSDKFQGRENRFSTTHIT